MGVVKYPTLSAVKPLLYKLVNRTLAVKVSDSKVAKKVKLEIKRDLQERHSTPTVTRNYDESMDLMKSQSCRVS